MKSIKIGLLEERNQDVWFDLSLREMRPGEVRFYKVDDLRTGKWLFKVCFDPEKDKTMVKAIKCPPGRLFSQLEDATMLFQKSLRNPDSYYDVVSITRVDQEGRVRREVVKVLEDIPAVIRDNFEIKTYEEATGRKVPGMQFVTLSKRDDEKSMIELFIIERAWTLPPEERQNSLNLMALVKQLQKTSITELSNIVGENFNVDKATLNDMLAKLEELGKIRRLDDSFVKAV